MKNLLTQLSHDAIELIRSIGHLAESQGVKAYLVGGPVRDLMLKCPNIDLDITVEGDGIHLARKLAAMHPGAKVIVYPAFKTATVTLPDGRVIDVASARQECYVRGGAFPAVKPSSMKDDLLRRDFTINAMAIAINPKMWGKLIDPFGGIADLKAGRIRVLHEKSFIDDPTRILRAARFKVRLGFNIERKTLALLKTAIKIKVLDTIKPQRYLKDLDKIRKEPKSKDAIEVLKSWNAYKGVV